MPRLSIVIPCVQGVSDFEDTLASVLQNRQKNTEVLVVQPQRYEDPYLLSSEVRFLETADHLSTVELINMGIQQAKSDIVNVLSCDVQVTDGWADSVIRHFEDRSVGSVTPRLVDQVDPERIVAVGVGYDSGGSRVRLRTTDPADAAKKVSLLGPTLRAGFFRRQAVLDAGGFCPDVGESLADIDLAIAMNAMGCKVIHESESVVKTLIDDSNEPISFEGGRQIERLFWRNKNIAKRPNAISSHIRTVVTRLLTNIYRPSIAGYAMGRLLACSETESLKAREQQLQSKPKQTRNGRSNRPDTLSFKSRSRRKNDRHEHGRDKPWRSAA